jgi:hypothetical protein
MNALTIVPARLWRKHPRELVALGGLALAGAIAAGGVALSSPTLGGVTAAETDKVAPAPPPLLVRRIAPTDALLVNDKIPVAAGPNPAAPPFSIASLDQTTRARALECLTSAIYYEAGQESADGQRAVAQVVLNRVRHPAFPSTICGVVYQGSTRATGAQFTFTNDGSLYRRPDSAGWARARKIAETALNGAVFGPVGMATHYHANYVVPYWASTLAKNAVIGAHLFYRWAGGWGKPAAFSQRYARQEPNAAALRTTALAAFAARPARSLQAAIDGVEEIPGAEVKQAPSGRLNIRFNLAAARKATDELKPVAYVEKVQASDTLRWTLSGGTQSDAKPLGRAPAKPAEPATATGGAD